MKAKSLILVFTLPLLFGFAADGNLSAPADTPVALVKKIVKDVTFKKAGVTDWEMAKTGLPLKDGEEVKTGSKSLALILFTDGSGLLRVRENAILHIYGKKENQKLNKNTYVQKGLIGFDVNKQENEEFKFTTPTVVASIRGTGGFLEVGSDSSTTISLDKGTVDFTSLVGSRGNGTVTGGNTAHVDAHGNIHVNLSTENDKKKYNESRLLNTKKVIIKTHEGNLEIEYYSGN